MIYAPISIRTLNRYECLKRCIESLKRNSWADKTEVYISVDYPPSEKYEDGYRKIINYLKAGIDGFGKVNIYFQKHNLGVFGNAEWVLTKICEKYDRYISIEDDMELAPGFIEFCDKGLELFEEDDSVLAINASDYVWCGKGYTPPVIYANGENVGKRQLLFHATAYWVKKSCIIKEFWTEERTIKIAQDPVLMKKLYRKSKKFFYDYLNAVVLNRSYLPWYEGEIKSIDMLWDIYMILFDKYVIYPVSPLLRDHGVDGNGFNYTVAFENAEQLKNREWLETYGFEYLCGENIQINEAELRIHDENMENSFLSRIKTIVKYTLWKIKMMKEC